MVLIAERKTTLVYKDFEGGEFGLLNTYPRQDLALLFSARAL